MLLDANKLEDIGADLDCDIVIVGAGTVGLFLAVSLANDGRRVVLVESGGRIADTSRNSLTAQSRGKQHYGVAFGRASGLGGTSVLWGGQLAEFEEQDLTRDEAIWPISFSELQKWYAYVYDQLGINARRTMADYRKRFGDEAEGSDDIERFFTYWLDQPNFATFYKRELVSGQNIRVILNATVNDINLDGAMAEEVIAVSGIRQLRIRGKAFVFATGTVATSRFFLSTQRRSAVPWRLNQQIGCYFQDHLGGRIADVDVQDEKKFREFFENGFAEGLKVQPKLRLAAASRNDLPTGISGFFAFRSEFSENISNIKALVRALRSGSSYSGVATLPSDILALARAFGPIVARYLRDHRVLALFDQAVELHVQVEQIPLCSSRITLSEDDVAEDGLWCALVNWQIEGGERETICGFARAADSYLQRLGIAKLRASPSLQLGSPEFFEQLSDTYHPCGGMRMSATRSAGVVDPDCRVWDTANVYVAGASVFPSSSSANCTLTALALAARLASTLAKAQ